MLFKMESKEWGLAKMAIIVVVGFFLGDIAESAYEEIMLRRTQKMVVNQGSSYEYAITHMKGIFGFGMHQCDVQIYRSLSDEIEEEEKQRIEHACNWLTPQVVFADRGNK